MIPTKQKVTIQSNMSGLDGEMRLSSKGLSNLMVILSELYSDPIESIVRELSTNMLDSHIVAKQSRPPEIYVPTVLNANLAFQDYGTGLSLHEIVTVYVEYGNSTKIENDDVTGCLGLGSKSPLAYSPSFTVQSVKDGRLVEMIIYKSELAPKYKIVVDTETDRPNGVRVSVPIKNSDFEKIYSGVTRFAQFLPENTIKVVGMDLEFYKELNLTEFVESSEKSYVRINDNMRLYKTGAADRYSYGYKDSWVVMGSAAYPIDSSYNYQFNLPNNMFYVFDVPPGAVEFIPSREGLKYTDRTKDYVDKLVRESFDKLNQFFNDYLENNDDKFDSAFHKIIFQIHLTNTFPKRYSNNVVKEYKGRPIEDLSDWAKKNLSYIRPDIGLNIGGSSKIKNHERKNKFNFLRLPLSKYTIVIGDREKPDTVLFDRCFDYLDSIGDKTNDIRFISRSVWNTIPQSFVEYTNAKVYDWEDIKKETKATPKPKAKVPVSQTVFDVISEQHIPFIAGTQYAYVDKTQWSNTSPVPFKKLWEYFGKGPVIALNPRQLQAPKYSNKIFYKKIIKENISENDENQLRAFVEWGLDAYIFNEAQLRQNILQIRNILPKNLEDALENYDKIRSLHNFISYDYDHPLHTVRRKLNKEKLLSNYVFYFENGTFEVAKQMFLLGLRDAKYINS